MWSKQADSQRDSANMTSLKSKITNRKRKSSGNKSVAQPQSPTTTGVVSAAANNVVNNSEVKTNVSAKKSSKKNKSHKKPSKKEQQKDVEPPKDADVVDNARIISESKLLLEPGPEPGLEPKLEAQLEVQLKLELEPKLEPQLELQLEARLEAQREPEPEPDVILDLKPELPLLDWDGNNLNVVNKRYSDSFVMSNGNNALTSKSKLSRAQSGIILTEALTDKPVDKDKVERKGRRFSDLFKHSNMKTAHGVDGASKAPPKKDINTSTNQDCSSEVTLRRKKSVNATANTKSTVITKDTSTSKTRVAPKKDDKPASSGSNTSYLKRVKSKIYSGSSSNKNKSERENVMPNISEDGNNKTSKKNKTKTKPSKKIEDNNPFKPQEIRKSRTLLDFHLSWQSNSNADRSRPKSMMPVKTTSNAPTSELGFLNIPPEGKTTNSAPNKPFLAKSKSSSSINLNLLRTRRHKIFDFLERKQLKMVEDEFEFIAFGGMPGYPLAEFGSLRSLNNNNLANTGKWNEGRGGEGNFCF